MPKISKSINSPKVSSGQEIYRISSFLYKYSGSDVSLLLKPFTLSLSLETGTYIYCWKTAYTTPHYKSGDRTEMNNYQPINIAPFISRIMERIFDKPTNYLLTENLISDSQYRFLKNRSCMSALI